jgi:hypothetical protein
MGVETWGSPFNTDPVILPEGGVETGEYEFNRQAADGVFEMSRLRKQ